MASNNLRILHNNVLSSATISASSSANSNTLVSNLLSESRSAVWRSASRTTGGGKANLLITFNTPQLVDTVVFAYTNLLPTSTIRIRGYSDSGVSPVLTGTVDNPTIITTDTVQVFNSGNVNAAPWSSLGTWNWGMQPFGSNIYSGGYSYARVYIASADIVKYLTIEITNPDSGVNYIDASYLMIGASWSPKYNTGYGMSVQHIDRSSNERTEAGDLVSRYMPGYAQLNFDLRWLASEDKLEAYKLFKSCGKTKPIFISLFPDNHEDTDKELMHQIIGKLKDTRAITHPVLSIYSTSIEIEEL